MAAFCFWLALRLGGRNREQHIGVLVWERHGWAVRRAWVEVVVSRLLEGVAVASADDVAVAGDADAVVVAGVALVAAAVAVAVVDPAGADAAVVWRKGAWPHRLHYA